MATATPKKQPNWMLSSLFGISLAIHLVIGIYVSGIYNEKRVTRIEVTIQDRVAPAERIIPRPQSRNEPLEKITDIERLPLNNLFRQDLEPVKIDRVEDGRLEKMDLPQAPGILKSDAPAVSVWNPRNVVAHNAYTSSNDYLAMVRSSIERHKEYPQVARTRQIEGEVIIHFVIATDGSVEAMKVTKSSGYTVLDEAGLKAVRNASPFPRPPLELFRGEIPIEIPIVFELT